MTQPCATWHELHWQAGAVFRICGVDCTTHPAETKARHHFRRYALCRNAESYLRRHPDAWRASPPAIEEPA